MSSYPLDLFEGRGNRLSIKKTLSELVVNDGVEFLTSPSRTMKNTVAVAAPPSGFVGTGF
jgi:hypothetical protein